VGEIAGENDVGSGEREYPDYEGKLEARDWGLEIGDYESNGTTKKKNCGDDEEIALAVGSVAVSLHRESLLDRGLNDSIMTAGSLKNSFCIHSHLVYHSCIHRSTGHTWISKRKEA
jgi:hypothetical protein